MRPAEADNIFGDELLGGEANTVNMGGIKTSQSR